MTMQAGVSTSPDADAGRERAAVLAQMWAGASRSPGAEVGRGERSLLSATSACAPVCTLARRFDGITYRAHVSTRSAHRGHSECLQQTPFATRPNGTLTPTHLRTRARKWEWVVRTGPKWELVASATPRGRTAAARPTRRRVRAAVLAAERPQMRRGTRRKGHCGDVRACERASCYTA